MQINESGLDRILRVGLGVVLSALLVLWGHPGWAAVGLVFVLTGLVGFCPAYRLLGLSTAARQRAPSP